MRGGIGRTTLIAVMLLAALPARAETLIVFSPNPFAPVLAALAPALQARTGDTMTVVRDTAGGLAQRIARGEPFDLAIVGAGALTAPATQAKFAADRADPLAKSGIGLAVRQGAPKPDIGSVEAFRQALLAAPSVAYTDPAAGGSSGIYLAGLFERLGIADAIRHKAVLVPGGLAAARIVSGEAAMALQQNSEVMMVAGAAYVGPLPAAIQSYTVYAAAVAASAEHPTGARALLADLQSEAGQQAMAAHGLERP
jgi:molybdate transport system substrate-binding protein